MAIISRLFSNIILVPFNLIHTILMRIISINNTDLTPAVSSIKITTLNKNSSQIMKSLKDSNISCETVCAEFNISEFVGKGEFGEVRAINNKYVLKKFAKGKEDTSSMECQGFSKYYGPETSNIIMDNTGAKYLKMKYIHGETLDSLIKKDEIPPLYREMFNEMIFVLNEKNIYHSDLTTRNIIYNGNSFLPIDIVDFSSITNKTKKEIVEEYNQVLRDIESRHHHKHFLTTLTSRYNKENILSY